MITVIIIVYVFFCCSFCIVKGDILDVSLSLPTKVLMISLSTSWSKTLRGILRVPVMRNECSSFFSMWWCNTLEHRRQQTKMRKGCSPKTNGRRTGRQHCWLWLAGCLVWWLAEGLHILKGVPLGPFNEQPQHVQFAICIIAVACFDCRNH
jgi:hypothetical protein